MAYIRFAVTHRAHFDVMFRPELYDGPTAPSWSPPAQPVRGGAARGVATLPQPPSGEDARFAGLAAWSIVHGFATLWLCGALPPDVGDDPETAGRAVIRRLFDDGN